jgi:malate synthase
MIINAALNSGAKTFMADLEDSTAPHGRTQSTDKKI